MFYPRIQRAPTENEFAFAQTQTAFFSLISFKQSYPWKSGRNNAVGPKFLILDVGKSNGFFYFGLTSF